MRSKFKPRQPQHIPVISYQHCYAKTYLNPQGDTVLGRTVYNHCQIVGEVAKELIARSVMPALFPDGAALCAASHDIGKVSPTFYNKIMQACGHAQIANFPPELEREWGGHAGLSQITAKYLNLSAYVPEILGQHHGYSPNVVGKRADHELMGGQAWQAERQQLLLALEGYFQTGWPKIESMAQARLVAGLTTVADWIGSGECFENPDQDWQSQIKAAVDQAGFVPIDYQQQLSFADIFGFPAKEIQASFAQQVQGPGVYVLEAPMGVGKTEAALYAAYQILSRQQASGVYFALPTQLTSNKIFSRLNQFLQQIVSEQCPHKQALLLHSTAWLQQTAMGEDALPGGSWFHQAKRGLLAPFAVGTIDQALMAVMNVKHGFVRAFGLASKVVILDEVHSYDAYTGFLLNELIQLLEALNCTVIILSATLHLARRQALLKDDRLCAQGYPLISARSKTGLHEQAFSLAQASITHVELQSQDQAAIEQALDAAAQGQQVLWIENTVSDAQQIYKILAARAQELGVECGLIHSRFTAEDRQRQEDHWVHLLGKNNWVDRQQSGRILVGTQILEQSLDIDADLLISRFAPTDMLLQRIGRLWRHDNPQRCVHAKNQVCLLAPELQQAIADPVRHFGSSAFVYSPYVLCRSLEVWQGVQQLELPADIRALIEATYQKRDELRPMHDWYQELENGMRYKGRLIRKGRIALEQLARLGLSQAGQTLDENAAQTRYSEADNHQVLLLRAISCQAADCAQLTLLDGSEISIPIRQRQSLTRQQWRAITLQLMQQVVLVHPFKAPPNSSVQSLKRYGLQHCFYLGSSNAPDERIAFSLMLVDEIGELHAIDTAQDAGLYSYSYHADLGYQRQKK